MVHDGSHQHKDAIKSGTILILSNHWDTLSFRRRRDGEMKVLLLSAVLGLLYAGHGEAQLLLKPVPGVVQAGRRSWGRRVCVSLLRFGHVDP